MPRGEWRLRRDFEATSCMTGESVTIPEGSVFILLDTNGVDVKVAVKGRDDVVRVGVDEFHRMFEPRWTDSSIETFPTGGGR